MSAIVKAPTFFPARINQYVPAMQYAADAVGMEPTRISFGTPIAAATADVAAATLLVNGAAATLVLAKTVLDGTYGRVVSVTCDATAPTGRTVTVRGRDFWNQYVREDIVPVISSTVKGKKALVIVDSITVASAAATSTLSVGSGTDLGLPYKTMKVLSEDLDDAPATVGTLIAPVLTDPQTATTGDPRGTYTPTSTLTGAAILAITTLTSNRVNASNRGGFMGIAHFFS